jgi:hypothetical protein
MSKVAFSSRRLQPFGGTLHARQEAGPPTDTNPHHKVSRAQAASHPSSKLEVLAAAPASCPPDDGGHKSDSSHEKGYFCRLW